MKKREPTPNKKVYKKPDSITDRNTAFQSLKKASQNAGYLYIWGFNLYEGRKENGVVRIESNIAVSEVHLSDSFAIISSESGDQYYIGLSGDEKKDRSWDPKPQLYTPLCKIQVAKLFTGSDFVYVLDSKNDVYSWGVNMAGQLGHGNFDSIIEPKLVEGLSPQKYVNTLTVGASDRILNQGEKVVDIACGALHVIVQTSDSRILSCGNGLSYALGHGNATTTNAFREIKFFTENRLAIDKMACGLTISGCLANGKLYIWGSLGVSKYSIYKTPAAVNVDGDVEDFKLGDALVVILNNKGDVFTMGDNKLGQLGSKNYNDSLPSKVKLPYKAEFITCGNNHVIVVTKAKIFGWGSNLFGQINPNSIEKEIWEPLELDWISESGPEFMKCRGAQTVLLSHNDLNLPEANTNAEKELAELKKTIEDLKMNYIKSKKENEKLKDQFKELHETISEIDSTHRDSLRFDPIEDPVVQSKLISDEEVQKRTRGHQDCQ